MPAELDPEDAKIVALARATRLRGYAPHTGRLAGAAVRDTDGRTDAAATVEHRDPRLTLSAVRAVVALAAASGARTFEAVAVVGDPPDDDDLSVIEEFGGAPVIVAEP